MAAKKPVPLPEFQPRRIALIKPSALGDVIHTLPVLSALRRRYPSAHLNWIVNRNYADLLRGHPDLDQVLPFDRHAPQKEWLEAALGYGQFFRQLRRQKFDLVIDLQGLFRSGLMTVATGASRRVGLQSAREGATWFYTDLVPVPNAEQMHAVDRYWLAMEALGAGGLPKEFKLPRSAASEQWANDMLAGNPRPWLMVGVGARWMTKRWPAEHFATLLRKAQERFGGTAIFVGGKDETSTARLVARRLHGHSVDLTGTTSLPQLTAVLACADAMIANDTGPLHLATALGRPVVAPYTCTKVQRTGPYGSATGGVESRIWCQGSYLKRCTRLECMTELTPFRLWPVLHEVLQEWEVRRQSA